MTKNLTYRITFLDEYGDRRVDSFCAVSREVAIGAFQDKYSHGCYKIVQVDVIA